MNSQTPTEYYIDYLYTDEYGDPAEATKREYFRDANALSVRRAELEDASALIIGVHIPKAPASDAPLEFLEI